MNPNEQNRLIEIMAELLIEVQGMRQEQVKTNTRLDEAVQRLDGTNVRLDGAIQRLDGTNARLDTAIQRLDRLEKRTEQNTAAIGELRVSVIKLADKLDQLIDLSKRVQRLEEKVFS